jgi:allantoinase
MKRGSWDEAWGGIASLELGLSVMHTLGASPIELAKWMSAAPAKLAGLGLKGRIAPGCEADFVLFDPDERWRVDPPRLYQRHKITPYAGRELRGRVRATWLRGEKIYDDGNFAPDRHGRVLTR